MATFSLQVQRVIIRFLHLRGATPVEIHPMPSWVRQFKEGRTSCDNKPKQSRPRTSRSDNMVERVEKVVLEDRRLSAENIASKVGISVGSVHTILHEDLRMRKVSSRWVPRMLVDDHKAASMAIFQAMLTRDEGMNLAFFRSNVTMDEIWMLFFNPETKRESAQWKHRRFSSGQNRLLQKRSQRPWNHGVDVVKNVHGCREITLKSDRSFKFLYDYCVRKKIGDVRT
ncbi:hypothetical protein B7P43_G17938 [Cryptotermes secundus]|uniref:Mos1 transposase HTH domain-containing protein n=1 Tax=Cryptotermes secundus TaxID=105785 RepID=A0A2J7Q2P7_9NEOP|nr:hypothetical protein B7P43_G17938 [Cryptotermes secundus]